MTDPVWQRDEPDSPCRNICLINPETRLCLGCGRTGAEIAAWPTMTAEERRALLDNLATRDPGTVRRRGGRSARRPDRG